LAGFDENTNKEKVEAIQNWFAGLSEEDRTLAMTIDYTIVNNEDEAKAALEEARKKAEEAGILKEALELEVDETTFDTYVEGIASVNKGLDENSNLTK
jgi:5,10-methylene-tetrahydrofolate dehydrogenase/methenyl tetrahydrofolate cyclohydrolase